MQRSPSGNHDVMRFPPVYRSFRIECDGYEAARTTYHDYIAPKSGFITEAFYFGLNIKIDTQNSAREEEGFTSNRQKIARPHGAAGGRMVGHRRDPKHI